MGELVLYGLLAVLIAAGLFLIAARFLPAGEQIAPPLRDEPPWELPGDRMLQADDVDSVRLPVAVRGYRFAETDILLDRLAGELRARDHEIARLRGQVGPTGRGGPDPRSAPLAPINFGKPAPAPEPAAEAVPEPEPEVVTETEYESEERSWEPAPPIAEPASGHADTPSPPDGPPPFADQPKDDDSH